MTGFRSRDHDTRLSWKAWDALNHIVEHGFQVAGVEDRTHASLERRGLADWTPGRDEDHATWRATQAGRDLVEAEGVRGYAGARGEGCLT